MGELRELNNEKTRQWHQAQESAPSTRPIIAAGFNLRAVDPIDSMPLEGEISASRWVVVEKVADDVEMVAAIECEELGYVDVHIADARKDIIEETGLAGIQDRIIEEFGVSQHEFDVAYARCRQRVIDSHELYEHQPHNY